jgi:hypothetical protein
MIEPFSVAGTAVGITHLGIQTCQILYSYYSRSKGLHNDIDSVPQQVEGLQNILASLHQITERFELDNDAPPEELRTAMQACGKVLTNLKAMADKCGTDDQFGGFHFRHVQKRLLWPYRKETLAELRSTLSGFRTI